MNFYIVLFVFLLFSISSCKKEENTYSISGKVIDAFNKPIADVAIYYSAEDSVLTDQNGNWTVNGLIGEKTVIPTNKDYSFYPTQYNVSDSEESILFTATVIAEGQELQILNWFCNLQLSNGLLESAENSNFVSLYDNALSALVFMMYGDIARAEKVFDFFDARIDSEFLGISDQHGFSQVRDRYGNPNNHRWMGDNAWLLIALNNYMALTGNNKYSRLNNELNIWLRSLQDSNDGGLWGGFEANGDRIGKNTEGNIDAYNAIPGYDNFHKNMLTFLESDCWNSSDKDLITLNDNAKYTNALDLHSWGYCIFEDFPVSTLGSADRFVNTQIATVTGEEITGYCFDIDKDVVWTEGTGEMIVALNKAGLSADAEFYLRELEKIIVESQYFDNSAGIPYASNPGSGYDWGPLWTGADLYPVISASAWYLFGKNSFDPFAVEQNKNIPEEDKFWLD